MGFFACSPNRTNIESFYSGFRVLAKDRRSNKNSTEVFTKKAFNRFSLVYFVWIFPMGFFVYISGEVFKLFSSSEFSAI